MRDRHRGEGRGGRGECGGRIQYSEEEQYDKASIDESNMLHRNLFLLSVLQELSAANLNRFGKIPVHQINFSPNCNCLAVVVIELICPAVPLVEYVRASREPVWAH